jgi:hypothetical protein
MPAALQGVSRDITPEVPDTRSAVMSGTVQKENDNDKEWRVGSRQVADIQTRTLVETVMEILQALEEQKTVTEDRGSAKVR